MFSVKGLDSSVISGLAYSNKVLAVSLTSGRKYLYTNVPKKVVQAFLVSDSKGVFYNNSIKGKYKATEV